MIGQENNLTDKSNLKMSERMTYIEQETVQDISVNLSGPIGVGEGSIHTDITAEQAEKLAALLPKYLVEVADDAPGCCIDGRGCEACLDGEATEARYSVAGGPLVLAYAMAELTGWFGQHAPDSTEQKLGMLKDILGATGITVGAHVDQIAVASNYIKEKTGLPTTGCGADDKAPDAALTSLGIASSAVGGDETAVALHEAFLGEDFQTVQLSEYASADSVSAGFKNWDPRVALRVVKDEDPHAVEVLEADESPTYGHAEALVVAVKIPGKTVDQKALLRDTGQQVFVVDVPYIKRIAEALATGPHTIEQVATLFHAGVSYHLGVYAVLCDGSQWFASLEESKLAAA